MDAEFCTDSTLNPYNVLNRIKNRGCFNANTCDERWHSLPCRRRYPDQNLLQFFLNIVEFNMTVQQATEAPNINTDQLWLSLGGDKERPQAQAYIY
jgi:hypothetical protein